MWYSLQPSRKTLKIPTLTGYPVLLGGQVWANTELIDTEGENLMHEVRRWLMLDTLSSGSWRQDSSFRPRSSSSAAMRRDSSVQDLESIGYNRATEFMARV